VDLYCNLPDWAALRAAADRCGVAVIEDAAEAIGSEQAGRSAGSFGDVGVFSFHGSKTLATGEGGMLVTDRTDIADRVKFLRDHGRTPGDRMFFNAEVAFKYKMNPVTAALGLAQLERLDELVGKKREIFGWYADGFRDVPGLTLNPEPPGDRNSYWMTTLLWDDRYPASKTNVLQGLWDRGIDARPFFHPLSSLPAYRDAPSAIDAARRNPTAYSIAARGVNLPSALCLTRTDVDRVVKVVLTILTEPRRPESA
jgi:perosamine synthetase